MKTLQDILYNINYKIEDNIYSNGDLSLFNTLYIEGIAFDSRRVKENYVFVAEQGEVTDGHLYIDKAISNGAKVIVYDNNEFSPKNNSILS